MNYFQITAFVNHLKRNKNMSTINEVKKEKYDNLFAVLISSPLR